MEDITLLRTELGDYMEKEPGPDFVKSLMSTLEKFEVSVDAFVLHLRTLPDKYRPGGSDRPKHWSWFVGVAKNLSDKCEHGNPKDGVCPECEKESEPEPTRGYRRGDDYPPQGNSSGASRPMPVHYDDSPEFCQIESTYRNPDPEFDDEVSE